MAAREQTRSRRDRDEDDDDPPARGGRGGRDRDRDDDRGGRTGGAKKFSYHPKDAIAAGIVSSGTWRVERSFYGLFDYGGTRKGIPALIWQLVPADGTKGEMQTESFTLGGNDWKILKGGEGVEPMKGQTGFGKNSKIISLFDSIVAAGGEGLIDDYSNEEKASMFEDLVFVAAREEKEGNFNDRGNDRGGRRGRDDDRGGRDGGKQKDTYSVLVVEEIVSLPGEGAKGGKGAKGGSTSSKSKRDRDDEDEDEKPTRGKRGRDADDDEDDDKPARGAKGGKGGGKSKSTGDDDEDQQPEYHNDAVEALVEALEAKGGKLKEADVEAALLKVLKGNKEKETIAEYAAADTFLELEEGWTYDSKKGVVTLDE